MIELKQKIAEMEAGLKDVPPFFWRFNGRRSQTENDENWTLWLLRKTYEEKEHNQRMRRFGYLTKTVNREIIGIKRNGNIIYRDTNRGYEVRQFKTFFSASIPITFSKEDETELLSNIESFLMFSRQKNGTLNAHDIIKCRNLEVRRELLRDFGYQKFVKELGGIVINRDNRGELIKLQVRKEEPMKFIKVKDSSTDREYVIRVPPDMKTCSQAIAWTFGMGEGEYHPAKET